MTNISAFKIYEGEKKDPQNIVLVADGMEIARDGDYKDDNVQKLWILNGALMMSAGASPPGIDIYQELKTRQILGPKAISKEILALTERMNVPADVPLDFIVAGYEDEKAKIYYINSTGCNPINPIKSTQSDKFRNERFYAFSGSGSRFANRIIDGQVDLGLDPRPRDITSGLTLMMVIAHAATESKGVNDKLQYGVVTPKGMHVLFHPNIKTTFGFEEYDNYVNRLMGLKLHPYADFGTEENIAARDKNRPMWLLGRDFYNAFELDLSYLALASRDFRTICDNYKDRRVALQKIEGQRENYFKAKTRADAAVAALLSGNAESIRSYLLNEREVREARYPV